MKKLLLLIIIIAAILFLYPKHKTIGFSKSSESPRCLGILKSDAHTETTPGTANYVCYGIFY